MKGCNVLERHRILSFIKAAMGDMRRRDRSEWSGVLIRTGRRARSSEWPGVRRLGAVDAETILTDLSQLETVLTDLGLSVPEGAAVAAATETLQRQGLA